MKTDILSLLDSKKAEMKDLEETGIHKTVYALYKNSSPESAAGLRSTAKKLIVIWKKILKQDEKPIEKVDKKVKPVPIKAKTPVSTNGKPDKAKKKKASTYKLTFTHISCILFD